MDSSVALAALTASCALITCAVWLVVLRLVPEPAQVPEPSEEEDPADDTQGGDIEGGDASAKVPYAALARPRAAALVALFSASATWVAATQVPAAALPPWLVLSTLGVALATVDGFTTWIPSRQTRWTWLIMAAAGAVTPALGASWTDLLRMVIGAVIAGGLYLLLWVLTRGGFGFGDVRFVPLVAAPAAAVSVDLLLAAMLAGTVLALVHGLWRHATHRPGWQPWAPALTLGAFAAAAAMA